MSDRVARAALALVAAAIAACADSSAVGGGPHPREFTGRWVRLREDRTWGDTMEFAADGSLHGSAGYPIPPSLRWEVKRDSSGAAQYCANQGTEGFCRTYRFSGDTLEMVGGPQGNTLFRRVH